MSERSQRAVGGGYSRPGTGVPLLLPTERLSWPLVHGSGVPGSQGAPHTNDGQVMWDAGQGGHALSACHLGQLFPLRDQGGEQDGLEVPGDFTSWFPWAHWQEITSGAGSECPEQGRAGVAT